MQAASTIRFLCAGFDVQMGNDSLDYAQLSSSIEIAASYTDGEASCCWAAASDALHRRTARPTRI